MADLDRTSPQATDARRAAEVFYDGACPVCTREIAMYRKSFAQQDIQWKDVAATDQMVAPDLSREDAIKRFHVRRADGSLVSGAGAFLAIWRNSGRVRWLASFLDRQPFLWVGDRVYAVFLMVRRLWRRPA